MILISNDSCSQDIESIKISIYKDIKDQEIFKDVTKDEIMDFIQNLLFSLDRIIFCSGSSNTVLLSCVSNILIEKGYDFKIQGVD